MLSAPPLQTHRMPAAHTSSLCHFNTASLSSPPHYFPPYRTHHPVSIISSLVPFLSPNHLLSLCTHSLKMPLLLCHTKGSHALGLMCTLLLNLCRRWAALAGNPTVIVSRLGDPDHKAGLARHEMASPCCSASSQTCRGETHLDKVHKRPRQQGVQVANVLRKPVEDSSWGATTQKNGLDRITVDIQTIELYLLHR